MDKFCCSDYTFWQEADLSLSIEARPENFPGVNDYRNPVVAEAMKGLKYVNMFNRGVSRVKNMLEENGNPKAEFDVTKLTAFEVKVLSTVTETKLLTKLQA